MVDLFLRGLGGAEALGPRAKKLGGYDGCWQMFQNQLLGGVKDMLIYLFLISESFSLTSSVAPVDFQPS